MNTVLVTSTDDGIGKTAISLALARTAQDQGKTVGYMKPKGTRLQSAVGRRATRTRCWPANCSASMPRCTRWSPSSTRPRSSRRSSAAGRTPTNSGSASSTTSRTSRRTDLAIVEGSDDLSTGSIVDLTDVDIAEAIDASVLLRLRVRRRGRHGRRPRQRGAHRRQPQVASCSMASPTRRWMC